MNSKSLIAIVLWLAIGGCVKNDEKYINLGQRFVVLRLHECVSIEDMASANGGGVPPQVLSLGYNERCIVAYAATNHVTNVWIIWKRTREVIGPLTRPQFEEYSSTNQGLRLIKQKDVWDY